MLFQCVCRLFQMPKRKSSYRTTLDVFHLVSVRIAFIVALHASQGPQRPSVKVPFSRRYFGKMISWGFVEPYHPPAGYPRRKKFAPPPIPGRHPHPQDKNEAAEKIPVHCYAQPMQRHYMLWSAPENCPPLYIQFPVLSGYHP